MARPQDKPSQSKAGSSAPESPPTGMPRRRFGATRRQVGAIGQGTWNLEKADRSEVVAAVRRGLDLGMHHVDTAEMYGSGAVEERVGEAIAGRRDEVFLVSKVLPGNASRKGTIAACERSLARLRTDRLDVYLLHWPGDHPLAETIAAFEHLHEQGKVLAWGVSNFDVPDLEGAHAIAGDGAIACNQVLYHVQERAIEHAVVPWCEQHDVAVVAYSPFGSGRFPRPRSAERKALDDIASAHGATPRQVALAFLLRNPAVFAIPKASSLEHVEENAAAARLRLSDADVARLDRAFPRGRRPRELPVI